MKIDALRRKKLISQHGFQLRHRSVLLKAKPLSRISAGQTRHCADRPCLRFLNGLKSGPGIEPELVCLFFPDLSVPLSGQILLHLQSASGHLQIAQTVSLAVSSYLIDTRAKLPGIRRADQKTPKPLQELFHALILQSGTKITGKHLSVRYLFRDSFIRELSLLQICFQKLLITDRQILPQLPWAAVL